jgi:transcription antitermination factor NusA-like protein
VTEAEVPMSDDQTAAIARLFFEEIPEIAAGVVEIKAIAFKPNSMCSANWQAQVTHASQFR